MVSILIAAYQAEKFLGKALQSLAVQTYGEFEAIIVDDGSTDRTASIAKDFADRDSRFRLIQLNENGGQAKARNVALEQSRGELICFLDADDWLADDALEKAVTTFANHPNTDSVLFSVVMEYPDHSEPFAMPPFDAISGKEAFRLSLSWTIHGVYMTRADIHRNHPYDTTARTYSDDNTTRIHYILSREVRTCEGIYHYRQHDASATHQVSVSRLDHLRANESMKEQMERLGVEKSIIDDYEHQRWMTLIDCCRFLCVNKKNLSQSDRKRGVGLIKQYWQTIDHQKIKRPHRWKFGYAPMPTFGLFWMQERAYFFLRKCVGRA